MKQQLKFFDPTQPQTLQIAVMLLYITAALDVIFLLLGQFSPIPLIIDVLGGVCAYLIANEKRIGYIGGTVIAALKLGAVVFLMYLGAYDFFNGMVALMFAVAMLILLIHPMSREYQKVWFR